MDALGPGNPLGDDPCGERTPGSTRIIAAQLNFAPKAREVRYVDRKTGARAPIYLHCVLSGAASDQPGNSASYAGGYLSEHQHSRHQRYLDLYGPGTFRNGNSDRLDFRAIAHHQRQQHRAYRVAVVEWCCGDQSVPAAYSKY